MSIDINWIQAVAALVLGFLLKVLFDELKSPRLRIIGVSRQPFTISPEIQVVGTDFDNYYTAYRVRVENKQKRYLNCAAVNCMAWLELDSAPEPYQICWVGNCSDVTINVGDIREVDFVARGDTTGRIYAPTERGYFEPDPRLIGDGKSELRGKLRITSKNGKREEKQFVIKPNKNQLGIDILDEHNTNMREPLLLKPLPWGILFFGFWISLLMTGNLSPLIEVMAWFFLGLSAILLCSIFVPPLHRILTKPNVSGFFAPLVFLATLLGFALNLIRSWANLQGVSLSISVYGGILWIIAYLLVLMGVVAPMRRGGRLIGVLISLIFIGRGIYLVIVSDILAGAVLIVLGILSIAIVFIKPQFGQRWPIV